MVETSGEKSRYIVSAYTFANTKHAKPDKIPAVAPNRIDRPNILSYFLSTGTLNSIFITSGTLPPAFPILKSERFTLNFPVNLPELSAFLQLNGTLYVLKTPVGSSLINLME